MLFARVSTSVLLEVLIGVRFRTGYHTQVPEISCQLSEKNQLS
jgi:hypothetical protein